MSVNWKIIFRGGLLPGFNIQDVKPVVQQWMRLSDEQLNRLFCGREITLKKGINHDEGKVFVSKMALLGLQVYLIEDEDYLSLFDDNAEASMDTSLPEQQKNQANTGYGSKKLPTKNVQKKYMSILGQHTNTARDNMHYIPDEHREKTPPPLEFSFTGRFGRLNYINANIFLLILLGGIVFFFMVLFATFGLELSSINKANIDNLSSTQKILLLFMFTVIVIFSVMVTRVSILRLHDLNLSGAWFIPVLLVCFSAGISVFQAPNSEVTGSLLTTGIILLNIIFLFLLICPGTKKINKFGSPANPGSFSGLILGGILLFSHTAVSLVFPNYLEQLLSVMPSSEKSDKTNSTKDLPPKKGAIIEFE